MIDFQRARSDMVNTQLKARGIKDPRVLQAMETVPRHLFVEPNYINQAYSDYPLPILKSQTISQPYIVALMTELAKIKKNDVVLDVGTGCGYQAAILGQLAKKVFSIEIIPELAELAQKNLVTARCKNVETKIGDGYAGWLEHAPYDAIIVAAVADHFPEKLFEQLKPEGRLIIPLKEYNQHVLYRITKTGIRHPSEADTYQTEKIMPVSFVPLVHGKE